MESKVKARPFIREKRDIQLSDERPNSLETLDLAFPTWQELRWLHIVS